jgi:hypothetical protein
LVVVAGCGVSVVIGILVIFPVFPVGVLVLMLVLIYVFVRAWGVVIVWLGLPLLGF